MVESENKYLIIWAGYKHWQERREAQNLLMFYMKNHAKSTHKIVRNWVWHDDEDKHNLCAICWLQNPNFCNFPLFWTNSVPSPGGQNAYPLSTTRITAFGDGSYWAAIHHEKIHRAHMCIISIWATPQAKYIFLKNHFMVNLRYSLICTLSIQMNGKSEVSYFIYVWMSW